MKLPGQTNNFYMRFDVGNSAQCAEVLENVICDFDGDRIQIDLATKVF